MNHELLEQKNPLLAFELGRSDGVACKMQHTSVDSQAEVLYLHGCSLDVKIYLDWLSSNDKHVLILLDDDKGRMTYFVNSAGAKEFLLHPRVYLCLTQHEGLLKEILWKHVLLPTESYALEESASYRAFQGLFNSVHCVASEYQDFGIQVVRNLYSNLGCMNDRWEIKQHHLNIPAIICGAGPSLKKHLPNLRSLHNRALIFAGGSAMPFLTEGDVPFHFGATFDPKPPLDRFLRQSEFQAPIFIQNRLSHDLFLRIHGPRIGMGDSGGYPIEAWIYENLGMERFFFDGGWTVADFMAKIALYLGCNPIICVGVDLLDDKPDFALSSSFIEELGCRSGSLKDLNQEYDMQGIVHSIVESGRKPGVAKEKLAEVLKTIRWSLETVAHAAQQVITAPNSGLEALYQIEIEGEVAYQKLLHSIWEIWKYPLERNWNKDSHAYRYLFICELAQKYLRMMYE